jgi:hypothetical protein
VEDTNNSDGDVLRGKVEIDLNMLSVLMLDGVGGEADRIDVVVVDQGGQR